MLTGESGDEDKIRAYDGGADDYLVKPFKLEELVAKIHAWLKRRQEFLQSDVSSTILTVQDLRLDLLKRRAIRGDQIIPLTGKEFEILEYLIRNKGKVRSQQMILNQISKVDYQGASNTVELHINHLRQKIEKGFKTKIIKTIFGAGYMVEDDEDLASK
jgi:DNA-binding response OmpR family regulator